MFIFVGGKIGVFPTLGMVLVTAVLGSILLRVQGFGLLARIRAETEAGRVPGRELVHGVMILIAGVLLLTPGFITDTLGFLLFIPPLRDAAWNAVASRITVVTSGAGFGRSPGPDRPPRGGEPVIDLEEEDFKRDPDPDSPWSDDGKR